MAVREKINLLELIPARRCESENKDDGKVVVLVPKFRHPWLGWLQDRLRQKYFHVTLDDFGSHVWSVCDGKTSVADIARSFQERFGEVPQLYERLGKFLAKLERDELIEMINSRSENRNDGKRA